MKNNILVLVMMLALAVSCEDVELLNLTPHDALTIEEAFITEENLIMYTNGFYEMDMTFPVARAIHGHPTTAGYYRHPWISDNMGDICGTGPLAEEYYVPGVYSPEDDDFWGWADLRRINLFLDNYYRSEAPENVKNHHAGLARWFRAKFYYDKVRRYGDVPWIGRSLDTDDALLYKARDPRTLVMDSVLADLNFAIEHLTSQKDNTSSTVTKWVALGLKARICLFEGTMRKYHPGLELSGTADFWLQEAADAVEELMQSGQYYLYSTGNPDSDYHKVFVSHNVINSEVMLALMHDEDELVFNASTNFYSNEGGRYLNFLLKRFVNTYLNIDGSRFTDVPGYDTIFFTREVKNRDMRLKQTIRTPEYERADGSNPAPYATHAASLYHPVKWSDPDPYYDSFGRDVNDVPLMRWAEMLLIYAEAKAELGTFTETDWNNTIGLLRERAGITNTSMPTTACTYLQEYFYEGVNDPVILEIRRERAIELALEAFRWNDLIRWRQAHNVERPFDGAWVPAMNEYYDLNENGKPDICFVSEVPDDVVSGVFYMVISPDRGIALSEGDHGNILYKIGQTREFPDYKYFMPIPNLELLLNDNLEQTEGW